MGDKYLTKWATPGRQTSRQIDYIMINAKYRNDAGTAQSNTRWSAIRNQNSTESRRRNYTTMQKIQDANSIGHRGALKYDIRELRLHPDKLTIRYQEQKQEAARTRALASNAQKQENWTMRHKNGLTAS